MKRLIIAASLLGSAFLWSACSQSAPKESPAEEQNLESSHPSAVPNRSLEKNESRKQVIQPEKMDLSEPPKDMNNQESDGFQTQDSDFLLSPNPSDSSLNSDQVGGSKPRMKKEASSKSKSINSTSKSLGLQLQQNEAGSTSEVAPAVEDEELKGSEENEQRGGTVITTNN